MELQTAGLLWLIQLVLVLAPWIYTMSSSKGVAATFNIANLAPHQYFFMLGIYPLASWIAIQAGVRTFVVLAKLLPANSLPAGLSSFLTPIFFSAVAVASLVVVADHFLAGRSIDKIDSEQIVVAKSLVQRLQDRDDSRESSSRETEVKKEAIFARKAFEDFAKHPTRSDLEVLPDRARLRALLDRDIQRSLGLVKPSISFASHLQVFATIMVTCMTVFCGLISYMALKLPQPNQASLPIIADIYRLTIISLLCLSSYPICFATYRAKLDPFVSPALPVGQHLYVGLAIMGLLAFFVSTDPSRAFSLDFVATKVAPIVVLGGAGLFASVKESELLSKLIGWDSTFGSNFIILLLIWVYTIVGSILSLK